MKTKMKPIIFNTELIPAIRNLKPNTWPPEPIDPGKPWKWQTRRIVKPQPPEFAEIKLFGEKPTPFYCADRNQTEIKAPYYIGDILWVRETFAHAFADTTVCGSTYTLQYQYIYKADNPELNVKWRPSIHMPRAAARLFLEVKNARAERVQEISGEDILREGVGHDFAVLPEDADCEMHLKQFCPWQCANNYINGLCEGRWCKQSYDKYIDSVREDLIEDFRDLWDSIYAKRGYPWKNNDWVFVYEFMRVSKP